MNKPSALEYSPDHPSKALSCILIVVLRGGGGLKESLARLNEIAFGSPPEAASNVLFTLRATLVLK